jgi:hypothetical protein
MSNGYEIARWHRLAELEGASDFYAQHYPAALVG